ncbi:MAG TPA: cyclodeaminase/cyclohydrolase family protein [Firmicutes bacterium]|nr:cyclodeaminase/cyclohydrolase family protein [Bacillota bacterium]
MQLSERSLPTFLSELGAKVPVPGGGGGAALAAALGAALGKMAAEYSKGKKAFAGQEKEQEALLQTCSRLSREFLALVDVDAAQFAPLARAYALPSDTEQEQEEKARIIEEATKGAAQAPRQLLALGLEGMQTVHRLLPLSTKMMLSDVGCAAALLLGGMEAGWLNVLVNAAALQDRALAQTWCEEGRSQLEEGRRLARELLLVVEQRLKK